MPSSFPPLGRSLQRWWPPELAPLKFKVIQGKNLLCLCEWKQGSLYTNTCILKYYNRNTENSNGAWEGACSGACCGVLAVGCELPGAWLWGVSFQGSTAGFPSLKMLPGAAHKVPGAEIPTLPAADFQASASAPAACMRRAVTVRNVKKQAHKNQRMNFFFFKFQEAAVNSSRVTAGT